MLFAAYGKILFFWSAINRFVILGDFLQIIIAKSYAQSPSTLIANQPVFVTLPRSQAVYQAQHYSSFLTRSCQSKYTAAILQLSAANNWKWIINNTNKRKPTWQLYDSPLPNDGSIHVSTWQLIWRHLAGTWQQPSVAAIIWEAEVCDGHSALSARPAQPQARPV